MSARMNKMPRERSWQTLLNFLKPQQKSILVYAVFSVFCLAILLYGYPYLILSMDSGSYVTSADKGVIGYRPYGYSVFLRHIHSLSPSMIAVILSQYSIYILSSLFFLVSIQHFWKLKQVWINVLWGLMVILSPTALYLSFSLLSDSLFISLTIFYLTTLLWMIYRPGMLVFALHLLILWCLLYTRFTAIAYVPVSLVAIYFTGSNRWVGLLKAGLIFMVCFAYYKGTRNQYARDTSIKTFSPFAGWQMLNNALHIYPETRPRASDFRDQQSKNLIAYLNQFPDTFYAFQGSHYIWNNASPLKHYLQKTMNEKKWTYFKTWTYLGDIYNQAGTQIILKYPLPYFKEFLFPVIRSLIFPSHGFCYSDNLSRDKPLSDYFKMPNDTDFSPRKDLLKPLAATVPWTAAIFWFATVFSAAWLFLKRKGLGKHERLFFSCLVVFFLAYSGINLLSGVIEIRYLTPIHAAQMAMIMGVFLTLPAWKVKIQG